MSEYRLSNDAGDDISEIYRRGYWTFGEHQADKFLNKLFDSLELLASFPLSGHIEHDIYPDMRRVEFNPYTVFYLPRTYGVYILRILRQERYVKKGFFDNAIEAENQPHQTNE